MSWAALALALLRALPTLLGLLKSIDDRARAASDRADGYNDTVRDQLERLREAHERDAASDQEADKAHAEHPNDDSAFDTEFRRKS
jgi:hypothetical protein